MSDDLSDDLSDLFLLCSVKFSYERDTLKLLDKIINNKHVNKEILTIVIGSYLKLFLLKYTITHEIKNENINIIVGFNICLYI